MNDLIAYLERLEISQGRLSGQRLQVFPWEKRFLGGAFRDGTTTGALSIGRGNGKSTVLAGVACATLDGPLAVPRGETILVASSFEQARIAFEHVLAFLGDKLKDRNTWRVWDTAQQARIENRALGTRVRCLGSDPRRAHGLAPVLVLADEPAQWPDNTSERMVAALQTASGKQPHSRFIAIGTKATDPQHWFTKMLEGGADYAQVHAAPIDDPPFRVTTWRKANPSLRFLPDLRAALKREALRAKKDPTVLQSFKALRLNQGVSDVIEAVLLQPETWLEIEVDNLAQEGAYVAALDLGTSAAMSAAAGYWPDNGRLDCFAVFPEQPSLAERGLQDGVGDLYVRCAERGELLQAGDRVSDIGELLQEVVRRWGKPRAIVCDSWRQPELIQELRRVDFPFTKLVTRRMGFKDGGEDTRSYISGCLDGKVRPVKSLLLRSAMAGARTVSDTVGNRKLAKGGEGRRMRARDDAVAASILAVAEGLRHGTQEPPSLRIAVV